LLEKTGKEKYIEFSPGIARGLAYYTGTVFECYDRDEKFRAILGGGRYDQMIEQFGGQPCPATGFGMGDVVLELFLREKGLWDCETEGVDYYVAPVNEEYAGKAVEIADRLRKKYSAEVDIMGRKLAKQLNYANNIKAKKVVIVGDETNSGRVNIKDMNSGKEETVEIDKI
jgi:histidyl-tRNA synthetase